MEAQLSETSNIICLFQHTEMQRELLKQERMYNERVSDRNQILVWLGLFGLLIPAYAIYAVCGARSVATCPQPLMPDIIIYYILRDKMNCTVALLTVF